MAETRITPTQMSYHTAYAVTQGAGTAINASDTMAFAYPKHGKLLIQIDSDHADTAATIAVGFGIDSGQGTSSIAAASGVSVVFMVESSRHKQADGDVIISWAANSAGFVRAFYLPAG